MGRLDTRYIVKLDTKATFFNPTLSFSINDTETSDLYIRVTNQHKLINISDMIPVVVVISPSGKLYSDFIEVEEDNLIYFDIKQSMKSETGKYTAKIMLVDKDEKKVLKGDFSYIVEDDEISILNEEATQDDRLAILTEFISRLSTIESSELSRQEAEVTREHNEEARELSIKNMKKSIDDLIVAVNKKVETGFQENSSKIDKLVSDTETKIDNYKSEKDEEILQDLQGYKEEVIEDIRKYKDSKDIQINKNLEAYKTKTTQDIDSYQNMKNTELDAYKLNKDNEINMYVSAKNKQLDDYKKSKDEEIDNYKDLKTKEIETAKENMISTSNNKIQELNSTKNELTTAINEKVNEVDERISELGSFESQLQQIETVNANQNERLNKVEYVNKRQDVMLGGLFNESADGRLNIKGEGNCVKLEGSKDGLVEIESVKGNTLVNIIRKIHMDTNSINDTLYYVADGTAKNNLCEVLAKPNTTYTVITNVIKNTINNNFGIVGWNVTDTGQVLIPNNFTGLFKKAFKTKVDLSRLDWYIDLWAENTEGELQITKPIIIEGDYTNKPIPQEYFEGMKSTFEDKVVPENLNINECQAINNNTMYYKSILSTSNTFTVYMDDTTRKIRLSINNANTNKWVRNINIRDKVTKIILSDNEIIDAIVGGATNPDKDEYHYSSLSEFDGKTIYITEGDYTNYDFSDYDPTKAGKYRVDYKVTGKNKFDFDSQEWKIGNGFAPNYGVSEGITIDYINKTIKLTKPSSCIGCHVKLKPNTQYYISCDISNTSTMTVNSSNLGIINKTFTTKDDGIIVFGIGVFNANTNDGYVLISNIQIEEGEVATPYEPYKESVATVYLDEPLYKDNELCVYDGKLGYWKNSDKVVLNGSEECMEVDGSNELKRTRITLPIEGLPLGNYTKLISDRFIISESVADNRGYICTFSYGCFLFLYHKKENLKEWLRENPATLLYELVEPVFVPILEDTPKWILESFNSCSVHFETNIPVSSSSFTYTGNVPSIYGMEKSVYGMEKSISDIEDHNVDMVATTFDMDYRLLEVEWALEDAGITGINLASTFNLNNRKGERAMALSRYEQAKIMILGGAYDKETLTRQLTRYLEKKLITQSEYDELISLMEAKELVTGE